MTTVTQSGRSGLPRAQLGNEPPDKAPCDQHMYAFFRSAQQVVLVKGGFDGLDGMEIAVFAQEQLAQGRQQRIGWPPDRGCTSAGCWPATGRRSGQSGCSHPCR